MGATMSNGCVLHIYVWVDELTQVDVNNVTNNLSYCGSIIFDLRGTRY